MEMILCSNCRRPYPENGLPYRCPVCRGVYEVARLPRYDPDLVDRTQPGIWRYRHTFGLPEAAPLITLGEGITPLVWGEAFGKQVAFKLEFTNPSGSYKDRGSAVLLSFLKSRAVKSAIEDSSGNAGASFAAYAVRAGLDATVYVPAATSGPKLRQIETYGAEIISIAGSRVDTAEAAQRAADQGMAYASHSYLPHGLPGYASLAYELFEQIGEAPGTVIVPAGQGNLLLAIGLGFQNLQQVGLLSHLPCLVGVQARACAPLWAVFSYGIAGMSWVTEGETLAEGVRIKHPLRGDAVLQMARASNGVFLAVDEEEILTGRDAIARQGFYVEPTSAIVWSALGQILDQAASPVVTVLTGSGLKSAMP